jgi:PKD repeat protein
MYESQNFKFFFLAALFTVCILVFAPTSAAIAMDYLPEDGCSFEINDGLCYVNESINFTDKSNFPQGYIREHIWDFNDGSQLDNSVNPTHTFTEPGCYTVNLNVSRNYVDYYTYSKTIEVSIREIQPLEMTAASTSTSLTAPAAISDTLQNTPANDKLTIPEAQGTVSEESVISTSMAGSYAEAIV